MQRAATTLLLALLCATGMARAALPFVSPDRQGYAFEYPRILAQQRLFGIYHGVALLATACRNVAAHAEATEAAHTQWLQQQQSGVEDIKEELAQFYYGPRAGEATHADLAQALGLRERLAFAPDAAELVAACASLGQALTQPRYDLTRQLVLDGAQTRTTISVRAHAQSESCIRRWPEEAVSVQAAWQRWQEYNRQMADTALAEMLALWHLKQASTTAHDWLEVMARRYASPSQGSCRALPGWLDSPGADLKRAFNAPSLMDKQAGAAQVFAVQLDATDDVLPLAFPAVQPELLDLFGKP